MSLDELTIQALVHLSKKWAISKAAVVRRAVHELKESSEERTYRALVSETERCGVGMWPRERGAKCSCPAFPTLQGARLSRGMSGRRTMYRLASL